MAGWLYLIARRSAFAELDAFAGPRYEAAFRPRSFRGAQRSFRAPSLSVGTRRTMPTSSLGPVVGSEKFGTQWICTQYVVAQGQDNGIALSCGRELALDTRYTTFVDVMDVNEITAGRRRQDDRRESNDYDDSQGTS